VRQRISEATLRKLRKATSELQEETSRFTYREKECRWMRGERSWTDLFRFIRSNVALFRDERIVDEIGKQNAKKYCKMQ